MRRLGDRYMWGELEESEYRSVRRGLEAQLAELPAPADSNVIAFDRAAMTLLPVAETIRTAAPEHQRAIIRHIVGRVEVSERGVL